MQWYRRSYRVLGDELCVVLNGLQCQALELGGHERSHTVVERLQLSNTSDARDPFALLTKTEDLLHFWYPPV